MIWESNLYLLAAIAGVATLAWMLEERIYVSASIGGGTWALVAITAAQVQAHTETGATVTRPGWMIQVVAAFLAAVSFLALVATYFGHYPPDRRDEKTEI